MKYEKLSEDEVTTEAQRLVAVPIVTYVHVIGSLFNKFKWCSWKIHFCDVLSQV